MRCGCAARGYDCIVGGADANTPRAGEGARVVCSEANEVTGYDGLNTNSQYEL
jgi:hypothetical protein